MYSIKILIKFVGPREKTDFSAFRILFNCINDIYLLFAYPLYEIGILKFIVENLKKKMIKSKQKPGRQKVLMKTVDQYTLISKE